MEVAHGSTWPKTRKKQWPVYLWKYMYILLITFVKMQGVELGGVYSLENPATDSVVVGVVVGDPKSVGGMRGF